MESIIATYFTGTALDMYYTIMENPEADSMYRDLLFMEGLSSLVASVKFFNHDLDLVFVGSALLTLDCFVRAAYALGAYALDPKEASTGVMDAPGIIGIAKQIFYKI